MLEDGCVAFDVCQDLGDSTRFVFYDAYRDQQRHRQRQERASFKRFLGTQAGGARLQ
jgi:quinol monooxygenase YgiN